MSLGGGHETAGVLAETHLATFVSMQGRLDEADAMFASLMSGEPTLVDAPRMRANLRLGYANHLTRRGDFEQAERELTMAAELVV
jgi:hypothetical protein